MKKGVNLQIVLFCILLTACGPSEGVIQTAIFETEQAAPTVDPTVTVTPPEPTPEPDIELEVIGCGYGEFGRVTVSGTLKNNLPENLGFVYMFISLVKNNQVIRTDEINLVNATGKNSGLLYGIDYESYGGYFRPNQIIDWSVAYIFEEIVQPFECEVSITDYR